MESCSYTDLREHLRERLDQVHQSRAPLLVTRQNAASAVLMDKGEYDALMETLHLIKSPANAQRLMRAVAEADSGHMAPHDLIDP